MRTSESAKPENSRIFYRDFNESEYNYFQLTGRMRPGARFDSVESKLRSALILLPILLDGSPQNLSYPNVTVPRTVTHGEHMKKRPCGRLFIHVLPGLYKVRTSIMEMRPDAIQALDR
jgi:hypothetical protein